MGGRGGSAMAVCGVASEKSLDRGVERLLHQVCSQLYPGPLPAVQLLLQQSVAPRERLLNDGDSAVAESLFRCDKGRLWSDIEEALGFVKDFV